VAASGLNTYAYGNCTYYVAQRFPRIYGYLGNAASWIPNARKQGYTILNKPAPDTVVVYGPGKGYSSLGHVAVVDSVNSDGTFNVSEMNYTGFNHIDQRRSTMADVQGFIVPPGSTYSAPPQQVKTMQCVTGSISFPGILGQGATSICFDQVVGVAAMAAGGLLMFGGVLIVVALTFQNSGIGQRAGSLASSAAGVFGGPVGAAVAVSSRANAPSASKAAVSESDEAAAAASKARTDTARARVSPEASKAALEMTPKRAPKREYPPIEGYSRPQPTKEAA